MPDIHLITPPDKLYNNNFDILLIYPNKDIKTQIQTVITKWKQSLNIYVYEIDPAEENIDWLLSVAKMSDLIIFDIDNSSPNIRKLASYIVANTNTYWLTNEAQPVYTSLSIKRIYDLSFLEKEENFGKKI
jgi:hypothetical protein